MKPGNEAWVYILECADGSFYVGVAEATLEHRVLQHQTAEFGGYTASRRPVRLVFAQSFQRIDDAIRAEKQLKGWSRAKKRAVIDGRFDLLPGLSNRRMNASNRNHVATP